ncbi:hypothetical protein BJX61DRAFT_520704 [Aspergillus egyptiacus]|nr:hypothetical protein BJX61DRAFT_520704 [Aspergillus egyptiacus]
MDDLGLRSPDHLRPLQPLLPTVAENASHLVAADKQHPHQQPRHPEDDQQHHHLGVDLEAQSLQPLQNAVADFDHYAALQHQNHAAGTRPLRQEDPYGALMDQDQTLRAQPPPQTYNPNESIFSSKEHGYLRDVASIVDPPDLEAWRERLFHVDEMIVMSEEQFRTYFPHVDNIYSHRSTQHYKRKPLISHYWDCRLKGRPPGTPKSDDPNKKKRKRTARQRDLCDVKIKITEYFPGYAAAAAAAAADADHQAAQGQGQGPGPGQLPMAFSPGLVNIGVEALLADSLPGVNALLQYPSPSSPSSSAAAAAAAAAGALVAGSREENQPFGILTPNPPLPEGHPGANGQRFFTIQRVNGNGANGKNDGVSGGHRHSLEESDRVKKNSVQRFLLKEARERKKSLSVSGLESCQSNMRLFVAVG